MSGDLFVWPFSPVSAWSLNPSAGFLARPPQYNNGFGDIHSGEDYNKGSGNSDHWEPIYCVADGTVVSATHARVTGWGHAVMVRHDLPQDVNVHLGNGSVLKTRTVFSQYGHLDEQVRDPVSGGMIRSPFLTWSPGLRVSRAQIIGGCGKGEGNMTTHLHLELRVTAAGGGTFWPGKQEGIIRDRYAAAGAFLRAMNAQDPRNVQVPSLADGLVEIAEALNEYAQRTLKVRFEITVTHRTRAATEAALRRRGADLKYVSPHGSRPALAFDFAFLRSNNTRVPYADAMYQQARAFIKKKGGVTGLDLKVGPPDEDRSGWIGHVELPASQDLAKKAAAEPPAAVAPTGLGGAATAATPAADIPASKTDCLQR